MSEIGGLGWILPFCVLPTVIVSPSLYCTTTTITTITTITTTTTSTTTSVLRLSISAKLCILPLFSLVC